MFPHSDSSSTNQQRKTIRSGPRCERTFISFENDISEKVFDTIFTRKRPQRQRGNTVCPITKLPARYFDPITQLPYRNLQAFKILREAYYQQLEERGNTDNPDVQRWLSFRRRIKEQQRANSIGHHQVMATTKG